MGTVRNVVPVDSADADGISVVTSTRSAADARKGMIYDPTQLAAVTPVHFHPLTPGRYLMVFSRRWHTASYEVSPPATDPAAYAAYTEDTGPGWVIVESSGARRAPGLTYAIPGADDRTLTGACSRGNDYLYLLSTVGSNAAALLQHFRWSPERDIMLPMGSETIANQQADGQVVVFDRGVYQDRSFLMVVGVGLTDHAIYLARKSWGRIGHNQVSFKPGWGAPDEVEDPAWRYRSATGWSIDPAELAPLPLTTRGPVSAAMFHDRLYLATVAASGSNRLAKVYSQRRGITTWTPHATPQPALGSVADSTYLGGTLQFQQHVRAMAGTAIPYLTSVKTVTVNNEKRIDVAWNTWPVVG